LGGKNRTFPARRSPCRFEYKKEEGLENQEKGRGRKKGEDTTESNYYLLQLGGGGGTPETVSSHEKEGRKKGEGRRKEERTRSSFRDTSYIFFARNLLKREKENRGKPKDQ